MLFDMDGTLIESEALWAVALQQLAGEYGGVLSEAARISMVGTDMPTSMGIFHADLGQEWRDPVLGAARLVELTEVLFAAGLPWRPGARELVAEVRAAGIPAALVTSTERRLVKIALETLGPFDAVVCGDEVEFTKPHPWPYRRAAELLGVPIDRCVAIEDSPGGMRSAAAAGAKVLAVPCEVMDLPGDLGATILPTLSGVDVKTLERL
ncbi:HAD family hydrolase [Hamadaea tsunoensis]|uniref:HAD family hydrolase n=1 Tax=Hamadaea tsunoensis TaxID=53368 RepID=UPI00047F43FA|nr:HAD family phosphatase [Hamadaea tsunoensis]